MSGKKRKGQPAAPQPLKAADELDEYEVWRHYRLHSGNLTNTPGRQLTAEESSAYNARYGRAIKYKYATLYKESVISKLADEQRVRQAEWSREEEERKLARREQAKEERADRAYNSAKAAREAVRSWKRPDLVPTAATPLPTELWRHVFKALAEYDPLQGMLAPCRTIATASLVCKEFTLAADSAWGLLKQECPPTLLKHHSLYCPWPKPGDPNSMAALIPDNDLVEQPQNLPLPTLKGICRNLNIAVSGTKAELIVRILAYCGLEHPVGATRVPHQVIFFALDMHGSQSALYETFTDHLRQLAALGDRFCRRLVSGSASLLYWQLCDQATRVKLQGEFGSFAGMQARLQTLKDAHACSAVKIES